MRNLSKQQRLENIQDNHDITRQIKQATRNTASATKATRGTKEELRLFISRVNSTTIHHPHILLKSC